MMIKIITNAKAATVPPAIAPTFSGFFTADAFVVASASEIRINMIIRNRMALYTLLHI